jgi:hypothetical protein
MSMQSEITHFLISRHNLTEVGSRVALDIHLDAVGIGVLVVVPDSKTASSTSQPRKHSQFVALNVSLITTTISFIVLGS